MARKAQPRPRPWIALDAAFLAQDTVAELADEFGATGPLTLIAIFCEAKLADLAGMRVPTEQGILSCRTSALARLVHADQSTVAAIIARAVELGILEHRNGSDPEGGRLILRSMKRGPWEPKDASAAARKARQRGEDDGQAEDDYGEQPF